MEPRSNWRLAPGADAPDLALAAWADIRSASN